MPIKMTVEKIFYCQN